MRILLQMYIAGIGFRSADVALTGRYLDASRYGRWVACMIVDCSRSMLNESAIGNSKNGGDGCLLNVNSRSIGSSKIAALRIFTERRHSSEASEEIGS